MKEKIINFMRGRNGADELNLCLILLYLILTLLSGVHSIFGSLSLVCIFYAFFRMFSKNITARRKENSIVLPYFNLVRAKAKNKGTHKVFMCVKCKKILRVPQGRGKVTINCPCGNRLKRKS